MGRTFSLSTGAPYPPPDQLGISLNLNMVRISGLQGSLNGTYFGGDQKMEMYGNLEGFSFTIVHEAWAGNILNFYTTSSYGGGLGVYVDLVKEPRHVLTND